MLKQWFVKVWRSISNVLKVIDELRINLTDKYTVMDTTACPLNSAQCEKIDKYCICHCYPGYSIINESCLKGNNL